MPGKRKYGRRKSYQSQSKHPVAFTIGSRVRWHKHNWEVGALVADTAEEGVILHLFRFKKVPVMEMGKIIGHRTMIIGKHVAQNLLGGRNG